MKNRKLIFVLIPLVIIVWALIFYRIGSLPRGFSLSDTTHNRDFGQKESKVSVDSFNLLLNYPDPFLQGVGIHGDTNEPDVLSDNEIINVPAVQRSPLPEKKMKEEALAVRYLGLVGNVTTKKIVGVFMVNNRNVLLEEQKADQGMRVLSLWTDSALVLFESNKLIVRRDANSLVRK